MRNFFWTLLIFFVSLSNWFYLTAQSSPVSGCYDGSQYVDFKNTGPYGGHTLVNGFQERAAQTYRYIGNGVLSRVRIYGEYPGIGPVYPFSVPLRAVVYHVDANGRPTTVISAENISWNAIDEYNGYKDVSFSSVSISGNFAVGVELRSFTNDFRIDYTGDGEGLNEDLMSLAGTSTGFNWTSAMTNFNKNGDIRIVPYVTSNLVANFTASSVCVATGQSISFSNQSQVEMGGMFNVINRNGYSGPNTLYYWDFGDGSTSILPNPSKTYTSPGRKTVILTVKHQTWGNGVCTNTYSMDISVGLNMSANSIVNVSCHDLSDGSAFANVSGGASPYQFSIDDEAWTANSSFSGLAAGSHNILVNDNLGCQRSVNFNISQPDEINFLAVNTTNANCGQANGAMSVFANGGTGTISYSLNNGTAQSSGIFNGLLSGPYSVEAEDANGCTEKVTVVINDQGSPNIVLLSVTNISCNGGNNGTVTVLGSGGTGALQYSVNGVNFQSANLFNSLTAGTYTVSVRDAAGCVRGFPIILTEPNVLRLGRILPLQSASCYGSNDGALEVSSSIGGIGTPSYSINGVNFQTSRFFYGLAAGTYTVTVRDAAGCTATAQGIVNQPNVILATTSNSNLSCYEIDNGIITVNVSGGVAPYQYQISGNNNWQFSNTFQDLPAGSYTINVRDANNCRIFLNAIITQPAVIIANLTSGAATCGGNDGTVSAIASGGSGSSYEYSIDGGNTFQNNGAFAGLFGGNYVVIVRDGAGCYNSFSVLVNSTTGPDISTVNKTDITCFRGSDGSINVSTSGGTGQVEYSIGGPYQTSGVFSDLSAGFYVVSVRDAVGCFDSDTITLAQGNPILVNANITSNVSCSGGNDGSVNIGAAGGIGSLAYSLNGVNFQSIGTFTGLMSNILYTAYVRDAGGCINFTNFSLTQPDPIVGNLGALNETCSNSNNGSVFVSAYGGVGNLLYSFNGDPYSATNSWNNLSAGTYLISIRDANNCAIGLTATITEPAQIAVTASLDNVNCAGGNDGGISVNVSGGTVPYNYAWSNGSTRKDLFDLEEGVYALIVTDANNCTISQAYSIIAPNAPIVLNGTVNNTGGSGFSDGAIDLTVTGGTAPYGYQWSNGAFGEDLDSIRAGFYIVIVTDANGCESSQIFNVSFGSAVTSLDDNQTISLFPNPAADFVTIEAKGFENNIIEKVNVLDALGKLVFSVQGNSDKVQLFTSNLSSGMYMVQIETGDKKITKKLSVIK